MGAGQGRARQYRPMTELPGLKAVAPWYAEWMRHPPGDEYWNFAMLPGRYDRVNAAVLNLSGWFDEAYGPSGAVENFQGAGDALVLGPWTHGGMRRSKAGERDFGPTRCWITIERCWTGWIAREGSGSIRTGATVECSSWARTGGGPPTGGPFPALGRTRCT